MKKLKIQKALLAICLALATTLQISNDINAMQRNTPGENAFKTEYKSKIKERKKPKNKESIADALTKLQESINKINKRRQTKKTASILSPKQALQEYMSNRGLNTIGETEYQQYLKEYINNNPATYLALLLLTKYNFLQLPENKLKDVKFKNQDRLHRMLLYNQLTLMDTGTPEEEEIKVILGNLQQLSQEKSDKLKGAAKILKTLFFPGDREKNIQTRAGKWKGLIKQSIEQEPKKGESQEPKKGESQEPKKGESQEPKTGESQEPKKGESQEPNLEESPYKDILILLRKVAIQLLVAVYDQQYQVNKEQLLELSRQVNKIYRAYIAYIQKPAKKGKEKEGNEHKSKHESTLTSDLAEIIEESNESDRSTINNEGTDSNIYDEGNWQDIKYDNTDEIDNSEKSLHSPQDNEETGKEINADNNSAQNLQTNNATTKESITTEEKKEPNTLTEVEGPTEPNKQENGPQGAKTNPNLSENSDGHNGANNENNINNTKKDGNASNQVKEEEERTNKEPDSNLTTIQKIINNLNATNKMIQIIMQILY